MPTAANCMRVYQQPAFVLHHSHYKETSLLLEVFSRDYGRLGLVAKGARRATSSMRAILGPFQPLLINWSGKGELATLAGAELENADASLAGEGLYYGFYLNELLLRLLHRHDPHEVLFDRYRAALTALQSPTLAPASLRVFEKHLLQEIGYGLVLDHDVEEHAPLLGSELYDYIPERGPVAAKAPEGLYVRVHGASLIALAEEKLTDNQVLRETKVLMRFLLSRYLGDKPLHTRVLFGRWQALAAHKEKGVQS